jgi:pyruvyltransferase
MRPIRLYWWKHRDTGVQNFGDSLSPALVERISRRRVEYASLEECDLVAIGSLVETVLGTKRTRPVHIWGTGFLKNGEAVNDARLLCAAVRGPITRDRLGLRADAPLGDPGLLADLLVDGASPKVAALGIVPHYVDLDKPIVDDFRKARGHRVISPLLPVTDFIRAVGQCDAIVSSSLHGLIVADALSIPNRRIRLSQRVIGGSYKFNDYFRSIGRVDIKPIRLPAPVAVGPSFIQAIADGYDPVGLREVRARLMASFPDVD